MRNKIAKEIKRQVYGDLSPRHRRYSHNGRQIVSDKKRLEYKATKRMYNALTTQERTEVNNAGIPDQA